MVYLLEDKTQTGHSWNRKIVIADNKTELKRVVMAELNITELTYELTWDIEELPTHGIIYQDCY